MAQSKEEEGYLCQSMLYAEGLDEDIDQHQVDGGKFLYCLVYFG